LLFVVDIRTSEIQYLLSSRIVDFFVFAYFSLAAKSGFI